MRKTIAVNSIWFEIENALRCKKNADTEKDAYLSKAFFDKADAYRDILVYHATRDIGKGFEEDRDEIDIRFWGLYDEIVRKGQDNE